MGGFLTGSIRSVVRQLLWIAPIVWPWGEIRRLREEAKARAWLGVEEFKWVDGTMTIAMRDRSFQAFAYYLGEMLDVTGAANFIEVKAHHPTKGPLVLTLQRQYGKSPADQRNEAVAESESLARARDHVWAGFLKELQAREAAEGKLAEMGKCFAELQANRDELVVWTKRMKEAATATGRQQLLDRNIELASAIQQHMADSKGREASAADLALWAVVGCAPKPTEAAA